MQPEECPECGERLVRGKKKVPGWTIAPVITYCQHCLWTERDPPENSPLVYEEDFEES